MRAATAAALIDMHIASVPEIAVHIGLALAHGSVWEKVVRRHVLLTCLLTYLLAYLLTCLLTYLLT